MISMDYDATSHAGIRLADAALAMRWATMVVMAALAGCGGQREQELKSASSWSVTALAVARYWEAGEVPSAYARRALKKAAGELAKGALPDAAEPVEELLEAVERGDRDAVRRLMQELSGQ